jgi:hypothetical protein
MLQAREIFQIAECRFGHAFGMPLGGALISSFARCRRAPRYRAVHHTATWTVQITITPACPDTF